MLPAPVIHLMIDEHFTTLSATPPALIATTRRTFARVIAGTRSDETRVMKSGGERNAAHGALLARRMPRHDATASCPLTAASSVAASSTSPRITRTVCGA